MRTLVFITAAMALLGGSSTLAQQVRSPLGGRAPTALGTINLGVLGQMTGGRVGTITSCVTAGSAGAPNTLFNATTADPLTGALPPPITPGATIPAAPAFGPSITAATCDPNASTRAIIENLGSSVSVTIPGLATIDGSTYADATTSPNATVAGGAGQSPQIIVPTPVIPSASPCVGSATIPSTVITDPNALAMTSGAAVAISSGVSSPSGC